jgi:hypothetical protein
MKEDFVQTSFIPNNYLTYALGTGCIFDSKAISVQLDFDEDLFSLNQVDRMLA